MKIGITGGIGSGKSYVCKRLARYGIEVYDCDAAAKRLIRTSPVIRRKLTELIGPDTYIDGQLNKAAVAQFLLQSEANAKAIDAIVHPAVFKDFEESGMHWMESAIMYESGICRLVDKVIVVTAPLEVRIGRVMQRDGISREKVLQWMQRQWAQEEVKQRADYEIVNDGTTDIDSQINKIIEITK
jgi:dephospho-CoA kinase